MTEADGPSPLNDAFDKFLISKGKGQKRDSGHYRRNAGREVKRFIDWATARGVESFDDIERRGDKLFREYARHLARRNVQATTVQTYWNYLSAFTGWCVREQLLSTNFAQLTAAKEPLPESDGSEQKGQQSWSDEQRIELLRHCDREAHAAIDEQGMRAIKPVRDRAIAYTLSYSAIRGGELLRDPNDDRRTGVTWGDLDLEQSQVDVFSKKQEWDDRAIPEQAHPAIERVRTVLDPPTPDWPLFPTIDTSALRDRARDQLGETDADPLAGLSHPADILDVYRDHEMVPPSLSTSGARSVMKRLTDEADIEVDRGEYLEPHGARRGVGRVLVLEQGIDEAAKQLDNSARVVEERYSDILTKEQAERTSEAFENRE